VGGGVKPGIMNVLQFGKAGTWDREERSVSKTQQERAKQSIRKKKEKN